MSNSFGARGTLKVGNREYEIYRLSALAGAGMDPARLPYSLRILLENLLRTEDGVTVRAGDIRALAAWDPKAAPSIEIAFMPARVLLQDFTGVPAVVDLAAMRDAMKRMGGDPSQDQSAAAGRAGHRPLGPGRRGRSRQRVFAERQHRVRAQQGALRLLALGTVGVPQLRRRAPRHRHRPPGQPGVSGARRLHGPGCGERGLPLAYPDTVVGTDSHTTMINGLGVLGWGVGGIEAEAAMLGQAASMLIPQVVGFKLHGKMREGSTATDLVLTVTEIAAQERAWSASSSSSSAPACARWRWPIAPPSPTWRRSTAPPAASSPSTSETLAVHAVLRPQRGADCA